MTDDAGRDLVERFFAASERGDLASLAAMMDEQMVMDWPQSGEQFRGRDNVLAAMSAVEIKPQFAGSRRLIGSGELWVLMVPLRYGDEVVQYVAVWNSARVASSGPPVIAVRHSRRRRRVRSSSTGARFTRGHTWSVQGV